MALAAGAGAEVAVGLMSGTSVDGIDVAVIEVGGGPDAGWAAAQQIRCLHFETVPWPEGCPAAILELSQHGGVADICRYNVLLGKLFGQAALQALEHAGIDRQRVAVIGSHGQTIQHLPQPATLFGQQVRATLQIGDPSVIAATTGITTVGDFRMADVARGGQGAPLMPIFDQALFAAARPGSSGSGSSGSPLVLLNIGGIANITYMCGTDIRGFDVGPGNMLLDALALHYLQQPFDSGGAHAMAGAVQKELLEQLVAEDPVMNQPPPKSAGRETYGQEAVARVLAAAAELGVLRSQDVLRTLADLTAEGVCANVRTFCGTDPALVRLVATGGGAHNAAIMASLQARFGSVETAETACPGIPGDAKEAVAFAFFGLQTLRRQRVRLLAQITGADVGEEGAVLGKICFA